MLATGTRPMIPPPIAESGVSYHTSDTVMRLDELPASMIIVGGGYVAAELAHLFSTLGVSIRIVSQAGSLLDAFDLGRARADRDDRRGRALAGLRTPGPVSATPSMSAGQLAELLAHP